MAQRVGEEPGNGDPSDDPEWKEHIYSTTDPISCQQWEDMRCSYLSSARRSFPNGSGKIAGRIAYAWDVFAQLLPPFAILACSCELPKADSSIRVATVARYHERREVCGTERKCLSPGEGELGSGFEYRVIWHLTGNAVSGYHHDQAIYIGPLLGVVRASFFLPARSI